MTGLARWRLYRDTKTCSCGATFFGLTEEADQWAADHLNKNGPDCKLMVGGPMLPPLDIKAVPPLPTMEWDDQWQRMYDREAES